MDFRVASLRLIETTSPTLIVLAYEDEAHVDSSFKALDKFIGKTLSKGIESGEITGKFKEFVILHPEKLPSLHLVILGVGKRKKYNLDKFRSVVAKGARIARRLRSDGMAVPIGKYAGLPTEESAAAVLEGALLGLYRFRKYKSEKPKRKEGKVAPILLVVPEKGEIKSAEKGANRGKILGEATNFVRDLVNEPSNVMTPSAFASTAKEAARQSGFTVRIHEKNAIEKLGMGAFLSVAKGSKEPPKLVVLEYRGAGKGRFDLGLVGKGVTFDSGGISIKPSDDMHHMTDDMAGAAACLGAMKAIAALKIPVNVVAVLPLAENLPSGSAYKPGDIVTSCSGKTIEVINTDAEGRMLLADALAHVCSMPVKAVVDIATLTGAVRVALGTVISGVFSADERLLGELMTAGKACDEPLWRMPLLEEYGLQTKGALADLKNSAGRLGGACTAAAFLKEFVGEVPWAHVDIAGTARVESDKTIYALHPYYPKSGATGIGARLLTFLAERLSKRS